MASGSFPITTSNGYISGVVNWSSVENVELNHSVVSATMRLSRTNTGYTTWGRGSFSLAINGNQKTNSGDYTFTYNSNTLCVTHTVTVPHNSDGSKVVNITASGLHSRFNVTSKTQAVTLASIPRHTKASFVASSIDMGKTLTIMLTAASPDFKHSVKYKFGARTGVIGQDRVGTQYWLVPESLATEIPNNDRGQLQIIVETYKISDGRYIGTAFSEISAVVPASLIPSFDTILTEDLSTSVSNNIGAYVANVSKLKMTITGASGIEGSTIKSYKIIFDKTSYYTNPSSMQDVIWTGGPKVIKGIVTDSRGRIAEKQITVDVMAYEPPKFTDVKLERADSNGVLNPVGEYAKIVIKGKVTPLIVGEVVKNTLIYQVSSKERSLEVYENKKTGSVPKLQLNDFTITEVIGLYGRVQSYDFKLMMSDFNYSTINISIMPSSKVTMVWGEEGIGVGKMWEQGALDVKGDVYIDENLNISGNMNGHIIEENRGWTDFTLINGWLNYSEWNANASYYKNSAGYVSLRGLIKNGITSANTVITNLPVGYRPASTASYVITTSLGNAHIDVTGGGEINIRAGGDVGFMFLNAISFQAAQ